jgi:hypothetical protein
MPRFYFHLAFKDGHTPDDNGKELATLNDAYVHARKSVLMMRKCGRLLSQTMKMIR